MMSLLRMHPNPLYTVICIFQGPNSIMVVSRLETAGKVYRRDQVHGASNNWDTEVVYIASSRLARACSKTLAPKQTKASGIARPSVRLISQGRTQGSTRQRELISPGHPLTSTLKPWDASILPHPHTSTHGRWRCTPLHTK